MKTFSFIAIAAICLAFNPTVKQEQHTNQQQAASNKERQTSVVILNDSESTKQKSNEGKEAPKWYRTVEWSNWALVIVALLTALAVWKQATDTAGSAKATREAAEATHRSVELQEVLNQQWLEFENWKIGNGKTLDETGEVIVLLSFDVVNTTKMPFTLEKFQVNISGNMITFQHQNTLAPGKRYSVQIDSALERETSDLYRAGTCRLPIDGSIGYMDAFRKQREQRFSLVCLCGPAGFYFFNN